MKSHRENEITCRPITIKYSKKSTDKHLFTNTFILEIEENRIKFSKESVTTLK